MSALNYLSVTFLIIVKKNYILNPFYRDKISINRTYDRVKCFPSYSHYVSLHSLIKEVKQKYNRLHTYIISFTLSQKLYYKTRDPSIRGGVA
jgi:hypothetical protein